MKIIENGTAVSPGGFVASGMVSGMKESGKPDLALLVSEADCAVAAVFTQNQVVAAPVIVDVETVQANPHAIRAVVTNSGNANACTGQPGLDNARAMQAATAEAIGCLPQQVLVLSTGVIGVQLPMEKITAGISAAAQRLMSDGGQAAAKAIMTTDTQSKTTAVSLDLSGGTVTIGGMAKGAAMIHPNMATMLGVITTDAAIDHAVLDGLLKTAINQSFNRISIDGDTSTNDTVLLLANGASGVVAELGEDMGKLQEGITAVCTTLAQMIVRDGEGATKFVAVTVRGAKSDKAAHAIANGIATSPLVKTAFAGSDPNWGRILMAAGKVGLPFDQSKTQLTIGIATDDELTLVKNGTPTGYAEADAALIFAQPEFELALTVGNGSGNATVWTTDLGHDYVTLNADYRT